jgi:hypothetical protein
MSRIAQAWAAICARELDPIQGYPAVIERLRHTTYEDEVRQSRMPGLSTEDGLHHALQLAFAGDETHEWVERFRADTIAIGPLFLAHPTRWEDERWWAESVDWHRFRIYQALALAEAWRDDREVDLSVTHQALVHATACSRQSRGYTWDGSAQSIYLRMVQLLLMSGDLAGARELILVKRSFKAVGVWYEWLRPFVLAIDLDSQRIPAIESARIEATEERFNRIRDPELKPERKQRELEFGHGNLNILRLQVAILRHKFVQGLPLAGNWAKVIRDVRA